MEEQEETKKLTKNSFYVGTKVILSYMIKYKRNIVLLVTMGILSAIGNGAIPYLSGMFFDAITSSKSVQIMGVVLPLFVAILIIWALVQVITSIVDWRSMVLSEIVGVRIWLDYLEHGLGHLLELPVSYHKKTKIGEVGNKINMSANALETISGRVIIDVAPQLLSIVIAIGIAFYLDYRLAFILLAGLVIYLFIVVIQVQPLAGHQRKFHKEINEAFGDSWDAIMNAHAIKQATAESYEQGKMGKKWKDLHPLWMNLSRIWSSLGFYQRLIILCTQILIFVISVLSIRSGNMTIGELVAFNAYAAMVFGPFITLARNWQTIQNGLVNIEETEKVINMEPEKYNPEDAEDFEIKGGIKLDHVHFHYEKEKPVLKDISFEVKPGEVIALVGESGVGKSTLIDLVSGYNFPEQGTVSIDGHDIRKVNLHSLRSQIAVVPQEVVLFNGTIETNVKYGNFDATQQQLEDAAKKAHALDFIEKFPKKWQQIVGERGIKLSVGQKQRVSIARAILRNPTILVLDEPTSALDAGSEKIITESLEELMKGKTTFIIAHRLSTVRKADKILVFKEGEIIESGKHEELLAIPNGEYRRLYDLQIGLHS